MWITRFAKRTRAVWKAAPEVFCVQEDDTLTVLIEEPPDALVKQVELAARLCPRAITLK